MRQTLAWIGEYRHVWRAPVLALLVVALLGPWTFTADGVPPAEWCDDRFVLLENGRCVKLVPGMAFLGYMAAAFVQLSVGLVTGKIVAADRAREFLFVFVFALGIVLLMLPFFSALLRFLGRGRGRHRVFHVTAWGLALLSALLLAVVLVPGGPYSELWGIWLFATLTAVALALELLALLAEGNPLHLALQTMSPLARGSISHLPESLTQALDAVLSVPRSGLPDAFILLALGEIASLQASAPSAAGTM